jgi:hypothetical protein
MPHANVVNPSATMPLINILQHANKLNHSMFFYNWYWQIIPTSPIWIPILVLQIYQDEVSIISHVCWGETLNSFHKMDCQNKEYCTMLIRVVNGLTNYFWILCMQHRWKLKQITNGCLFLHPHVGQSKF